MRLALPTIGILPGWSVVEGKIPDRYLASVLRGIQSTARARRCHLLLAWGLGRVTDFIGRHPAWPVASLEADFVPVGPWNTDGLIIFAPLREASHSQYLKDLSDQGFPVVFIATGERDPMISVDNRAGIRLAVAHLVEHGHRDIAFIAGDPTDPGDSAARLEAYQQAVAEFGLAGDPRLVVAGWHNFQGGYDAARILLGSGVPFTGLLGSDDSSAIGAMKALREASRRIPQDVAVVGFDDQPDAVAQVPPLTSVHVPLNELGRQALNLLLDHLLDGRPLASIEVATRLARRQSCGCLPPVVASAANRSQWPAGEAAPLAAQPPDIGRARGQVTEQLVAAMQAFSGLPMPEAERQWCERLVAAFHESLLAGDLAVFQAALMDTLQDLELANTNFTPWQEMISALRREMTRLPAAWGDTATRLLADDLLHLARAAMAESAQRQDDRHQSQREIAAHALGELTAQLSAVLDHSELSPVLEARLADVGVRHARVALYEHGEDDPYAWSAVLHPAGAGPGRRFRSREFPPPGLYPADELLNLALVPLVFQEEALGYAAFDAANLEPVPMLARQLAATIQTARLHAQVLEFSLTDSLTGVYNRRYFDLFLANEVDRSRRFGRGLAVILLDVDNLKQYNDSYGHPAGDRALQFVAQCLEKQRRRADVVARIGGDEFALILPETETDGAEIVARRISAAVSKPGGLEHPLTVSMGISILHGASVEAGALVQRADHALYQAKRTGRNAFRVYEEPGRR